MKVILEDINYRGVHFKKVKFDLEQFNDLNDTNDKELSKCIADRLDELIEKTRP